MRHDSPDPGVPAPWPRYGGSSLAWAFGRRTAAGSCGVIAADAVLCALTAACYDSQVRELGLGVPQLWPPEDELAMADHEPDGAELVRQKAWIYFPK